MGELLNSGLNVASDDLFGLFCLWVTGHLVFVNRASSRTNEQIELLEALLEQQSGRMRCCVVCARSERAGREESAKRNCRGR